VCIARLEENFERLLSHHQRFDNRQEEMNRKIDGFISGLHDETIARIDCYNQNKLEIREMKTGFKIWHAIIIMAATLVGWISEKILKI
jgi:hypothetical protein